MAYRTFFTLPLAIVIFAVAWMWRSPEQPEQLPLLPGRNNTVLFITSDLIGLSNPHLATSLELLENHLSIEVHYASFARIANRIEQASSSVKTKNPTARSIIFHELPGPDLTTTLLRTLGGTFQNLLEEPGAKGMAKKINDFSMLLTTWTAEEHWTIYRTIREMIDQIDPSLVVFDHIFRPAMDLPGNLNRPLITISPNALLDLIADQQPWGGMFWKYPAAASGFLFPLAWHIIPLNIYAQIRIIYGILTKSGMASTRAYLRERGVKNPLAFGFMPKNTQVLSMTLPEANLPMDFIPPEVTFYGPAVLNMAPAKQHDAKLVEFLEGAPGKRVLVNLGSVFRYTEEKARNLAEILAKVLDKADDVRMVWKFWKEDEWDNEEPLAPLQKFIEQGRLQVHGWLEADPVSLLQDDLIDVFVHHGGGNSYHEAVLTGVPQVALPMWYDCYNFASTAEYLGIGIWAGRHTAPVWEPDTVANDILRALVGEESVQLRQKAQALGEIARSYGGCIDAAKEVARLAGLGGSS